MSEEEAAEGAQTLVDLQRGYGLLLGKLDDLDDAGPVRRSFLKRRAALGGPSEPVAARAKPLPRPEPPPATGKKQGRGGKTWIALIAIYIVVRILMRALKD